MRRTCVMNILAIGSDARGNHYLYGLADIIRLVRVDFVNARVTVLEVPRDLWVEIPEISDHYGITQGKLNQAYLYGNKGLAYYDGPGEGPL
jgi:anionic cell wall polymer biosynthesis LytR-Cps2A-Psr (LCP) family protein